MNVSQKNVSQKNIKKFFNSVKVRVSVGHEQHSNHDKKMFQLYALMFSFLITKQLKQ